MTAIKIYFSAPDLQGKSFPLFIDVDKADPRVIYCHKESILGQSNPGCFDEDGIMPGFALHHNDKVLMYYSGWNAKFLRPTTMLQDLPKVQMAASPFVRTYESTRNGSNTN